MLLAKIVILVYIEVADYQYSRSDQTNLKCVSAGQSGCAFVIEIWPWDSKTVLITLVLIIYLFIAQQNKGFRGWKFRELRVFTSPFPHSHQSSTLEFSRAAQTSAVRNADKRLMEKPLSKALTFPSHIALALSPSTYPGNLEDTCWSVTVLLESCVPCTVFLSLAVSFQWWLCWSLCYVHCLRISVYLAKSQWKDLE